MRGYLVFSVFKPLIFKLDLSDYLQTDLKPAKYHFETPFLPTEQRVRSNNSKIILHKFGLFFFWRGFIKISTTTTYMQPFTYAIFSSKNFGFYPFLLYDGRSVVGLLCRKYTLSSSSGSSVASLASPLSRVSAATSSHTDSFGGCIESVSKV